MTFPRLLCSAVINRGLLLQGQQGAAGAAGMKGQKVSHAGGRCHIWLLPLFVLPAPRLARRRGGEEAQWALLRLNYTDNTEAELFSFLWESTGSSPACISQVYLETLFGKMFNSLLKLIAKQPIARQQLGSRRPAEVEELRFRTGKKGGLKWLWTWRTRLLAPDGGSVWLTARPLGFPPHPNRLPGFTENGPKKEKATQWAAVVRNKRPCWRAGGQRSDWEDWLDTEYSG